MKKIMTLTILLGILMFFLSSQACSQKTVTNDEAVQSAERFLSLVDNFYGNMSGL